MTATHVHGHQRGQQAGATSSATAARQRPQQPDVQRLLGNRAFSELVVNGPPPITGAVVDSRLGSAGPALLQRCGGMPEPCPCHGDPVESLQRAPLESGGGGGLRVGAADDAYEQEAARVSAAVMTDLAHGGAPAPPPVSTAAPSVQRATDPDAQLMEDGPMDNGPVEDLSDDDVPDLQAFAHPGGPRPATAAVARYVGSLGSAGGQALPAATRQALEPRFGRSFGDVRVHNDSAAAAATRTVHASAFTVGSHIVFGPGRYAPGTTQGQALLAHELTHVVQQSGGRARPVIQRAPWGACPPGPRLPAIRPDRYASAEYQMLAHYRSQRGYREWASNVNKFWEIDARSWSGEPARMLRQFQEFYVSHKGPVRRRSVHPSGSVPAPGKGGSVLDAIEGSDAAIDFVSVVLQPDIIDFRKREIYDVTTTKMTGAKRAKVIGYAALATGITGRLWTPGRTLPGPGPFNLVRMHVPGELICFGATDLARNPGVLSYEVISTKKKKEKKKKDKKKDSKKKDQKKKDTQKKDTKKKDTKKDQKKKDSKQAPGASGGNIGFGISLGSTGGGSANAVLGVSVMSHGTSYGTVSAGVVYDSSGQAVGAVGAGATSGSSSTGAGVAGAGASKDSTSIAAGTAGAGTSSGSTTAAAGAAGAGSSKDDTVAAAGVAGQGKSEGNLGAAAGRTGSGDVQGQVGAAAGGTAGPTGTSAGGTSGSAGTTGTTAGGTPGQTGTADSGTSGTGPGPGDTGTARDAGSPGGTGTKAGSGSGTTGTTGTPGKYGLPIPGQAPGDVDRAVEQAAQMEAMLRTAKPAQRVLMEGLARKQASGTYVVTGTEWVRLMLSASQDVKDEDVPRLLELEWTPGKVTAEELRAAIRRVLADKHKPSAGTTPAKDKQPGKKPGKPPPQQESSDEPGPTVRKKLDKKPPTQTAGVTGKAKDDKKPKESIDERITRLAQRAAAKGAYNGSDIPYLTYDKDAKLNTAISASVYLVKKDPRSGQLVWTTADVVAVLTQGAGGKLHVRITGSSELVLPDGRYAPGSEVVGLESELTSPGP